jgi:DHA1 family bicyclomycin/chloramphenicol resistance-like MFS transporter
MPSQKNLYLLLIIFMMPLTGFGIDIYTPSFPAISNQLQVPYSAVKMTVSLYLIGLCIGQPAFGVWSDSRGRKATLLVGCVGFLFTSLVISFLANIYLIMAIRILQGFFVAAVAVNCRSLVADVYTKEEIPAVSTYLTMAWSLGPIIAPLIGSYLQYYISWQSNFYFLAVYALIIFFVVIFKVQETNPHLIRHPIARIVADYILILRHKQFMGALFLMSICYAVLVIFPLVAPFLVQIEFHKSPIFYGRLALLVGLTYLLGSIINRFLLRFFSIDALITSALCTMIILNILFVLLSLIWQPTLLSLYGPILLIVFSTSLIFPNCMGKSISFFPQMAGKAAAIVGTGFMFLTAVISIITNYLPMHSQLSLAITFLALSLCGIFANKLLKK